MTDIILLLIIIMMRRSRRRIILERFGPRRGKLHDTTRRGSGKNNSSGSTPCNETHGEYESRGRAKIKDLTHQTSKTAGYAK